MSRPTFPAFGHMSKEPRLAGKVAVISGASRGFGQAIAVRFVEEGARVVMLARSSCEETFGLIRQIAGVPALDDVALHVAADISSEEDCRKVTDAVTAKWGAAVHVLVNNAALFVFKSVEDATADDWDRSASVNIRGHALLTKAVLPLMKNAGGGSVVWQGSISAHLAQPGCATYSAMKAAIVQLARNCAYDLAKYNIRSNTVSAGTIETPISAVERKEHGWTYEEWERLKTGDVMMGRVGNVREIANATLYFASDESSFCTGTELIVDGGQGASPAACARARPAGGAARAWRHLSARPRPRTPSLSPPPPCSAHDHPGGPCVREGRRASRLPRLYCIL